MGGAGLEGDRAEILRMQDGVRATVLRAASGSGRGLREVSPRVLLSLLCAGALSPLFPASAGITDAAAVAGIGVLSSVGAGVLSGIVARALDRLRPSGVRRAGSAAELEEEIARQIERALAAGDANARTLRAEIAAVLEEIDAGGTALRAAMEDGSERVRSDVIAAIGRLGAGFAELGFLVKDVARAAAEIQQGLDEQGADVRATIEQNARQSTEIRLAREDLAVIERRTRAGVWGDASAPAMTVTHPAVAKVIVKPNNLAGHAFISYVREDSRQVDQLQGTLQAAGVPVWRDTRDLWPGEDWRAKIRRAITNNALVFIACFSQASLSRGKSYQNEELTLAIDQLRLRPPDDPWLIPVRLDECEIPDRDIGGGRTLTSIQRADLFGNRSDESAERLVAAILRILGRHSDAGGR
jgi:uncharacterized protein YwlG (UPF0340 family)